MKRTGLVSLVLISCLPAVAATRSADLPDAPEPASPARAAVPVDGPTLRSLPLDIVHDQAAIWTSPAHLRLADLRWLLPLGAAFGAALATDHTAMQSVVSHDASFNSSNVSASNGLIGALLAAPAGLFAYGQLRQEERSRETGLRAAEAIADGVVVEQGLKLVFWRERPTQDNGRGLFFQSSAGPDSSFPSSHAVLAWSTAEVLAAEYRSPWLRAGVYTVASGVSLTRVFGQQHFPSDVLVGSAAGWLIGHYVAHRSHRGATVASHAHHHVVP